MDMDQRLLLANRKVSLIALDLDGTVLDQNFRAHPRTLSSIRKVAERVPVIIVTGRMWRQTKSHADAIGNCAAVICGQGSVIHSVDGTIQERRVLNTTNARDVILHARNQGWNALGFVEGAPYAERLSELARSFMEIDRDEIRFVDDATHRVDAGCEKIVCVCIDEARFSEMKAELDALVRPTATVVGATSNLLEVTDPSATKGAALADVCTSMGISGDEVLAIGDNDTDATMFDFAKVSVAVSTAPLHVKQRALAICPPPDQAGVADVLEACGLI